MEAALYSVCGRSKITPQQQQQQKSSRTPPLPSPFPEEKRQTNETNRDQGRTGKTNGRPNGNRPLHDDDDDDDGDNNHQNTHHHSLTSHSPHNLFWGCSPIICSRGACFRLRSRRDDDEELSHSLHPTTTTTQHPKSGPVQSSLQAFPRV